MNICYLLIVNGCSTCNIMPINNIQFRAEIGNFNIILQRVYCVKKASIVHIITSCLNSITLKEYFSYIKQISFHMVFSIFSLIIFPFIVLFKLSFFNLFNLSNCFIEVYIFVYLFMHFIINLLCYVIVYHKAYAKFTVY